MERRRFLEASGALIVAFSARTGRRDHRRGRATRAVVSWADAALRACCMRETTVRRRKEITVPISLAPYYAAAQ